MIIIYKMKRQGKNTYGLYGTTNSKLSDENNKIIRKELKYSDVEFHYTKQTLIIPDYQRALDVDKINEIKLEIEKNNGYLNNCTNPIQLASIQQNNTEWKHYILDGQHRLSAILEVTNLIPNNYQSFVLHICSSEREAIKIFEKLIKGQEKLYLLSNDIFNDDFRKSRQYQFREYLKKYYPEHFVKSEKNKWIYTIDTFLKKLNDKGFFEKKKKGPIKMKDYVMKKLSKFCKKINYENFIEKNPTLLYKKEHAILKKCDFNCMGLKNNNFIDYIFTSKNNKITPFHKWKENKQKIPKKNKDNVWNIYYKSKTKKQCPITNCKKFITKNKFHAGHIISEKNGGTIDDDNLHPICSTCNGKMGTKNWDKYDKLSYLKIMKQQEELII